MNDKLLIFIKKRDFNVFQKKNREKPELQKKLDFLKKISRSTEKFKCKKMSNHSNQLVFFRLLVI